jgi:ABC-type transport system involved in cytochrome bd biosynthesis fused ATPase/permease subunit
MVLLFIPDQNHAERGCGQVINRRLIALAGNAKAYVFLNVLLQWAGLLANAVIVFAAASFLGTVLERTADFAGLFRTLAIAGGAAAVRAASGFFAAKASFRASAGVKRLLREKLYGKLLTLGAAYTESLSTAEVLQTATEGVEQLEVYFGKYLPQFFYSILAPLTLFALLAPVSLKPAAVLLACVPLIPALITAIMKMAKNTMKRHWKSYVSLGDMFLENIQGMTTLKVYSADGRRQQEMRAEAEVFRKSTMRVLKMQLNSIIIMDAVAFGGAALGVILAALGYRSGDFGLPEALVIVLLSAEFFIPLRLLGSYFHIAMNGMAACDRMFQILDMESPEDGTRTLPEGALSVEIRGVSFAYGAERAVLSDVAMTLEPGGMVSLVGASGSGKSTVAALLAGRRQGYGGSLTVGGVEIRDASREDLHRHMTLVTHDSYVFSGTVGENLRLGKPDASEGEMREALERVRLYDFFSARQGLNTTVAERGANLSGGQRQRLCIARAFLRGSAVYIFDEATSNIDAESEEAIMDAVGELAKTKTVLLITHRLANAVPSRRIYLLEQGRVKESGAHAELLSAGGRYARLFNEQTALENCGKPCGQDCGQGLEKKEDAV